MRISEVTVSFRKQVADGNFGTEACEVALTGTVDEDEGAEVDELEVAEMLLADARKLVYKKLDESPNVNVRHALRASKAQT
jgi:hypothetical protein